MKKVDLTSFIAVATDRASRIVKDESRNSLLDDIGLERLRDSYMKDGENSPQDRYAFVSAAFASNDAHAQRMYEYSSSQWFGYATPVLSFGRNKRGLPISCFGPFVGDTSHGLVDTLSETNWMSMLGGGVGLYFGIRSKDEKSAGMIPHMKVYDSSSLAYKQGTTRRGSYAINVDISHPEIVEVLNMRKVSGGDPDRKCLNLHNCIVIPDAFMEIIERCMHDAKVNDDWELRDPSTGEVKDVVSAKALWEDILELRSGAGRGEPFIMFSDTVNNAAPEAYKKYGLKIHHTNLCTEITLASDDDHSFVCALSSYNLLHWDLYKDNHQFFLDTLEFMDNVLQTFIDYAPTELARAVASAKRERSIGLGVMGYHSYLQSKMLPFGCGMSKSINKNIFAKIREHLNKGNLELGALRGSPEILEGTGKRFCHVMALAPTASNALITGNVSPSIEPLRANAFRQDTLSGSYTQKNKILDNYFHKWASEHELPTTWVDEQWHEVIVAEGSVQTLKWMPDEDKEVFLTAAETDNLWIIEQAGDRQEHIDQSQSLNMIIEPTISRARLHFLHFLAWKKKVKTLYYCRTNKLHNTSVSKRVERKKIEEDVELMKNVITGEECISCEG